MAKIGRPKGAKNKTADDVRRLAQKHGARAIARLAELMDCDNVQASVAACKEILDRAYGKAPQAVTGEGGTGPVLVQWLAPAA